MSNTEASCRYLITGSNSYLGKKMASYLALSEGNQVFTTSRSPSEFDKKTLGSNHQHLSGIDLLHPDEISRLASTVSQWADGSFHIVNCAGYFPGYKPINEIAVDEAKKIFESNVLSLYATANKLLPIMCSKGGGHFIAFSSHAVTQSYPLMAAFLASKAAVGSLIQSIANEYARENIIANALAIATLDSPRERNLRPTADSSDWLQIEQILRYVEEMVRSPFSIMNGNNIHLYNYSDSFFHQSYFDRLGIVEKPQNTPD